MYLIIIICILYITIIIRTYLYYNKDAKPYENIEYYRERLEIEPSEAAFLCNKNEDGIYLILADILSLVGKGFIKLDTISKNNCEKEYILYKNSNLDFNKMKNHEVMSYELFFDINQGKEKIYLTEFLEKLVTYKDIYKELEIKSYSIKYSIKTELEKQNILDENARIKMQKINSKCISWGIITIILIIISLFLKNDVFSQIMYATMIFILILYNITDRQENKITQKGADILEKCKAQKRYIEEYILVEDKPIYTVNFLDYYYTMAIAFGMADFGRKEFYKKSIKMVRKDKKKMNSILDFCAIFLVLFSILITEGHDTYINLKNRTGEMIVFWLLTFMMIILPILGLISLIKKILERK